MEKPKTYEALTLPSDFESLKKLTESKKKDLMESVIDSVEYAISQKLPMVHVFKFKDSDYVISLYENQYSENVDNIYSYFLENELYELCGRVNTVQQKLKSLLNEKAQKEQTKLKQ